MVETDLAWLAGIIDGEGYVSLQKQGMRRPNGTRNESYRGIVALDNTSVAMIDRAQEIVTALGLKSSRGSYVAADAPRAFGSKQVHRLTVVNNVDVLLRAVLPYLVTEKREYAEAIVQMQEVRPRYKHWTEKQKELARSIRAKFMPSMNGSYRRRSPSDTGDLRD